MKKLYLFAMTVAISVVASAQTVNVHFKNGTTVNFPKSVVDHIDFSEKAPDPTLTAGDAVDMGLSVMWASCNVGATSPEENGPAYAWGETTTKENYWQDNYAYYDQTRNEYINIGNDIAGTAYDAATANLGKGWKMPTKEQVEELMNKCTWTRSTLNDKAGWVVTATNGNTIFIGDIGYYSTSTEHDNGYHIYELGAINGKPYISSFGAKFSGRSIRPVISYDDYLSINHSGDEEVTSKISARYSGGSVMQIGETIRGGSQLNFTFVNASDKDVTLTGVYLVNGVTGNAGNNGLSENVTIGAGKQVTYTITVGAAGIQSPLCRFTYMYNYNTYTVETQYE